MSKTKRRALVRGVEPDLLVRAAEIIKMLGHPERLKIVEVLEDGEATVSAIRDTLNVPQAIVSQHLARMRGAGIVAARREGVNVFYRVVEPKVWHVLQCIRTCDM
jgi:ArsR family transcriptional regulator